MSDKGRGTTGADGVARTGADDGERTGANGLDRFDTDGPRVPGRARRAVLRAVGGAGAAAIGIRTMGRVRADGDGVPLVLTRRPDGTPERVRSVPAERRRRLRVYRDLDVTALVREFEALVGVSVTAGTADGNASASAGSDDLALALLVERASRAVRRSLPDELHGVPTTVVERSVEGRPARTCKHRILTFYEPVVGGVPTFGMRDGGQLPDGTVGLVCWDADEGDLCLLTAAHVALVDGDPVDDLYHDGEDDDGRYREEVVGRYAAHSTVGDGGVDVAKYRVADGASAGPLVSVGSEQPDVTGCWDFAGLADATTGGAVPVCFAGRSTCYAEAECVGTFRSNLVDYAVRVTPDVAVAGDSGGAFLDPRGRLVGLFTHRNPRENSGPVGSVALDRVGAQLRPPD